MPILPSPHISHAMIRTPSGLTGGGWRRAAAYRAGLLATVVAACLVVGCHDARRQNPVDPELTPPVGGFSAQLDESQGVVALQWQRYSGRKAFAHYLVLRREVDRVGAETLATIDDVNETAYLDTAVRPGTDYDYVVEVVNAAGFANPSDSRSVTALEVSGVELLAAEPDSIEGVVRLRWQRYRGPGFEGYEVVRSRFGSGQPNLFVVDDVADTSFTDTTALPDEDYLYSVDTVLFGQPFPSAQAPVSYALPAVQLTRTELGSETACAELAWTAYEGPRFDAYALLRKTPGSLTETVTVTGAIDSTVYTDCGLEGDTPYSYSVFVRTRFISDELDESGTPVDVGVQGLWRVGRFYAWEAALELDAGATNTVQALAIDIDAADELYAAATYVTITTADNMQPGIHVARPAARTTYSRIFPEVLPARLSPIRLIAEPGRIYVAVSDTSGSILVGAIDYDDAVPREAWLDTLDAIGDFPSGLSFHRDGTIGLIDELGYLYFYQSDGTFVGRSEALNDHVNEDVPLAHARFVPEVGAGSGNDEVFYLSPDNRKHKILGATQIVSNGIFGGTSQKFDDGVGIEPGQTLNPLALAYDPSRGRLVILESRGIVQVADVEIGVTAPLNVSPYITRWGSLGRMDGQFLFNPTTAASVAVDSRGRIHVADAAVQGGRIQIFAP